MQSFSQKIGIIGVNACVIPPERVLAALFARAGKSKGPIPVRGKLNGAPFTQTVVKYAGEWRLYLNLNMLGDAGLGVGDLAHVEVEFDPVSRAVPMHPLLAKAFTKNKKAKAAFDRLAPYRKKEILRYLGHGKNPETVARNVEKTVQHLLGKKVKGLIVLTYRK